MFHSSARLLLLPEQLRTSPGERERASWNTALPPHGGHVLQVHRQSLKGLRSSGATSTCWGIGMTPCDVLGSLVVELSVSAR
eukprot:1281551-Alexandrium_andersonii.AAC.1